MTTSPDHQHPCMDCGSINGIHESNCAEHERGWQPTPGKPSWDKAPEWAEWLAQDSDGTWCWFEREPDRLETCWGQSQGQIDFAAEGYASAIQDWRETLEHRSDGSFTFEPMPKSKINLNLRDTYRACDVKRWGIVKTLRPQSVAEHAYQVTIIASRICDLMEVDQATRQEVLWVALTHDLPEVLTGDMATPLKEMIGPDARQRLKEFERNILVTGRKHFSDNETVNKIVKMADLAEAIAFLNINAATQHGEDVKTKLEASLMSIDKHIAGVVMYELTCIQETTLDCIQDGF